jgi:hypothetical protein|tara:strand:- start:6067 stop:6255 length:189 start_codon:yes stop_codon:yes gene_type:complete
MNDSTVPAGLDNIIARKDIDGTWTVSPAGIKALKELAKAEMGIDDPVIAIKEVKGQIEITVE